MNPPKCNCKVAAGLASFHEKDCNVMKPYDPVKWDVLRRSYGWTVDVDGQLCGLTAGDHGYEPTGIFIPKEDLLAFAATVKETR